MFHFQPRYLGLDLGKSQARFAQLRKTRSGWSVLLKELSKEGDIASFCAQFKEQILVSAVSTREMLMRPCEIALTKPKDIFAALDFHAEPLLPYPIERAIIQATIVQKLENCSLLNIFSVRKDHLLHHLEGLKQIGFEPEVVSSRPHALAALSTLFDKKGALLMAHEGEEELSLALVADGQLLAARAIDSKAPILAEIQKTFLNFSSTYKKPIEGIYFFGKTPEVQETLLSISGLKSFAPASHSLSLSKEEWELFGLAIGTALASNNINFRQKDFAPALPFKRLKRPLAAYLILCVLLTGSLLAFETRALSQKKAAINEAYLSLLQAEKTAPSPCQTPDDYLYSLNDLEKKIKTLPKTFSLLPQLPKTKEVVAWLIAQSQNLGDTLVIESMHYQMVKRPTLSHGKEHYKVRVVLELSAKDPNTARLFQEALKDPQSIVDPSEELQWSSAKGKYKASFYLKDKTRYL